MPSSSRLYCCPVAVAFWSLSRRNLVDVVVATQSSSRRQHRKPSFCRCRVAFAIPSQLRSRICRIIVAVSSTLSSRRRYVFVFVAVSSRRRRYCLVVVFFAVAFSYSSRRRCHLIDVVVAPPLRCRFVAGAVQSQLHSCCRVVLPFRLHCRCAADAFSSSS